MLGNSAPDYFVTDAASPLVAIREFGPWVCRLPMKDVPSGRVGVFEDQTRIEAVLKSFGPVEGWRVLELGSFEGADTYNLEAKGANVTGIEANRDSFMRSLVAKDVLGMHAQFWLGDFRKFLAGAGPQRWDMIFAAGVLYHMPDPIELLWLISQHTDRTFIWSMYVSDENAAKWPQGWVRDYQGHGINCHYFLHQYSERFDRSYSGVEPIAARIAKTTIVDALKQFGFSKIDIHQDVDQSRIMLAASKV